MKKYLIAAFVVGVIAVGYAFGSVQGNSQASKNLVSTPTSEPTQRTSTEIPAPLMDPQAALAWSALMDESGEYAAFAVYSAVIEKFGLVEPYVSILEAEQKHIDALIRQLEKFGVVVPANPYLGKMTAPQDLVSAAAAWASGEVANVELYDELLAQTTESNLQRVFTNLRRASNDMHLPMFEAAAKSGGTLTNEQMASFR